MVRIKDIHELFARAWCERRNVVYMSHEYNFKEKTMIINAHVKGNITKLTIEGTVSV